MDLSVSNIDWFCFKTGNNYYPRMLLEKCGYIAREEKVIRYITDDLQVCCDDCDKENPDEED